MLKFLQARLQQYMNRELPDIQAGIRKGRRTRDQIANILWVMKKAREFQRNTYSKDELSVYKNTLSFIWDELIYFVKRTKDRID